MKKVLGIVASYRKIGNSEIVTKAIAEKMGPGWDLSLIRLPRLKIQPCKGCYSCLLPGKECNIKDDVYWILERIKESDALIFSAPNYAMAPVGMVKMFADRTIQAFNYYPFFKNIKAVVALTLGKEDYRGYADTALVSQVGVVGLDVVMLRNFYGTHPGEVAFADDYELKIEEMARALAEDDYKRDPDPNRCPRCFSDLFRIHPKGLECAICKSIASFPKSEGDPLDFFFFHPEFTDEGRLEHMKWLYNKKDEYPRIKEKLKEVQNRYKTGHWLSPHME